MQALARSSDPQTSHAAADQIERTSATDHRRRLLAAVLSHPGLTCAELARQVGLDRHQCGKRLPELRQSGLIDNGPARVCSIAGSRQMVWVPVVKTKLVQKGLF